MLMAYCHLLLISSRVYLAHEKVLLVCNKCLAKSGWRYIAHLSLPLAYNLQMWQKKSIEPCCPIRSKLGLIDKVPAAHIIMPTSFCIYRKKYIDYMGGKSFKKLNQARLLLRPRSIHTCQQKPNPSGDPVPLNAGCNWSEFPCWTGSGSYHSKPQPNPEAVKGCC